MKAVIVKLYFCVEMNSCNKVVENVIIDVLFIHLLSTLSCELPQCLFLGLTASKYQFVVMM